ncbi:MAG: transglycosylase domain-containing protein [Bdellovibrionaceae bacterium]|nr:transglycosylase domain-containing protein [Bdellovibrionales bacterium]MCB9255407.1 transglycosylase domain-containing protein [Pseudobdellovibrionaceae bacterium]
MSATSHKKRKSPKALAISAKEQLIHIFTSPIRAFKFLCFATGVAFWSFAALVGLVTYLFFASLPDVESMNFTALKKVARGQVYERFEKRGGKHIWVPLSAINRDFLYAVVLSEDRSFFEHDGVNYGAIMQAFAANLKKGRPVFGGSTISQQVAKNLFLDDSKTFTRKLKEVILTRRLEATFSKNELLEIYLNLAEFGPDIFGAESVARNVFRKPPSEINAAEGAFIALLLPSPRRNFYSLVQNRHVSEAKREKLRNILKGMLYNEYISPKQYSRYVRYDYTPSLKRAVAGR